MRTIGPRTALRVLGPVAERLTRTRISRVWFRQEHPTFVLKHDQP